MTVTLDRDVEACMGSRRQLFINGQWCDAASGETFQMPDPGSPPGIGRAPVGSGAAKVIRYLTEDHDLIAQRMNDVVVRRIFAAGLDLQVALGLIGDHSGAGQIYYALDELDQAIKDIRDTIFDRSPPFGCGAFDQSSPTGVPALDDKEVI